MGATVLLLGHGKQSGQQMAIDLAALGFVATASTWADFPPRRYGRGRPDVLIADMDKKTAQPMELFAATVRRVWGANFPIIALTESTKFKDISSMIDAGADDCIAKNAPLPLVQKKINRCLSERHHFTDELTEEVPLALLSLFSGNSNLVRLESLASIHPGAAPRHPTYRRLAPPDSDWRGVVTADAVERFQAGKPDAYLRWSRLALFRLPVPDEYAVKEKVLLRRAGPPLAAAVDRSRLPAGPGMYAIVPKEEGTAGYLTCILNSRLMDFYFNRLASGGNDGRLRIDMLKSMPLPRPTRTAAQELNRIAVLLEHFGPNPQSWIDRQTRDELSEQMEQTVFSLYQASEEAVASLEAMHF